MAKVLPALDDDLIEWMLAQPLFFVASAPSSGGHVNISPKGHDSLRVIDGTTVAYLDLTGSGAETIAHTRDNGRLTIMFCAFDGPPRILRLFGRATAHPHGTDRYAELEPRFPPMPGGRSIVELALDRIQTSCGYAVPLMDLRGERATLHQWAARRDETQLARYWADKNARSIDGLPALDV